MRDSVLSSRSPTHQMKGRKKPNPPVITKNHSNGVAEVITLCPIDDCDDSASCSTCSTSWNATDINQLEPIWKRRDHGWNNWVLDSGGTALIRIAMLVMSMDEPVFYSAKALRTLARLSADVHHLTRERAVSLRFERLGTSSSV